MRIAPRSSSGDMVAWRSSIAQGLIGSPSPEEAFSDLMIVEDPLCRRWKSQWAPAASPLPLIREHIVAVVAADHQQPGTVSDWKDETMIAWDGLTASIRTPAFAIE